MRLYNCFLWSQFEYRDVKLFDLEEDLSDKYYSLISKFIGENNEYNLRESILRKEFEETDLLEKKTTNEEEKEFKRQVQSQVIRRIPGYEFFESFKHGWRTCSTHGKNMTAKHMVEEHLFGEPGNWQGKLEIIQVYVGEIAKPFYSKVQKSMRESAQKLAARIKQLIKTECEPYQKKKLNTMQ